MCGTSSLPGSHTSVHASAPVRNHPTACSICLWAFSQNSSITPPPPPILSFRTVAKSICAAQGATDCFDSYWKWAIIFAAIQVLMVQMPDLSYFCKEGGGGGGGCSRAWRPPRIEEADGRGLWSRSALSLAPD